jgi:hypothetical protein
MMKIYIAGPMTGVPKFNVPFFDKVAAELREVGYDVVSPAELDSPEMRKQALTSTTGIVRDGDWNTGETWGSCLARDVLILSDTGIEAIALLPGWKNSRGASLEATVGLLNGLKFFLYGEASGLHAVSRDIVLRGIQEGFTTRWNKL